MGAEYMGCIFRIRNCASDLLLMEDDVIDDDDKDLWELIGREIRLKASFLFCDLNRVIMQAKSKRKKSLSDLGNKLFHFLEELDDAVKSRSISLTQLCYSHTTHALQEVMAALLPPREFEYWKISCIALRRGSEEEKEVEFEEELEGDEEEYDDHDDDDDDDEEEEQQQREGKKMDALLVICT